MVHTWPVRRLFPSRLAVLAVLLAVTASGAACSSSDGRVLPPPKPGQTTTVPSIADGSASVSGVFSLSSPEFAGGDPMPVVHTCDGAGTSPPLQWASTPPAAELAVVVRDPDAGGFVHWVVTGIDPLVQGLAEGAVPEGAVEATNDAGTLGWTGPCPPAGTTHTYELVLHALPEPLTLEPGTDGRQAAAMVEGASSAQAVLTATYSR